MNRHLLAEWRRLVNDGDTIICLGNVAHPDAFRDRRLMADMGACPGERILVRGNDDTNRRALENAGFTVQHRYALYAADPPLALSHEPLQRVPVGAVNAHAHLHEGIEPTRRHLNLTVEKRGYQTLPTAAACGAAAARYDDE